MSTEQATPARVLVIGGGVIGLSTAYHLVRAGHAVTLLERDDVCGRRASWGNAGWIVPSLVHPFNSPGAAPQALRSMLDEDSPIAIRQPPTPRFLGWGLRFLRASRADRSTAAMQSLSRFAGGAADQIRDLADELGFECHRTGLIVPFRSPAALADYEIGHAKVESLGYRGRAELLDAATIHSREPELSEDVIGGLHLLDEPSVRPDSMTTALVEGIRRGGGTVVARAEVRELRSTGPWAWECRTADDRHRADAVVVAAGEHTASVLRGVGVHLPLQSGRGCSVTLPAGTLPLRHAMKVAEHRVACTPFDSGEVRVSGSFDLVRPDAPTDRRRMASVLRAASNHLPALRRVDLDRLDVWSGARPCTPDSVPVVGPVGPTPGLLAATGHGTLGMTLAVETGRRITATITAAHPRT